VAKLDWAVLCEKAIIEAETRNLSLVSLLETVKGSRPADSRSELAKARLVPHRFSLVQQWSQSKGGKPEVQTVRSKFVAPNGKLLHVFETKVDLRNHAHARTISGFPGFPFEGEGDYTFTIQARSGKAWRSVGKVSFSFQFSAAPKSTI